MTSSVTPSNEKAGVVEDFFDIFVAPSAVYERRRDSSPWIPLLVVSVVLGAAYLATSGAMEPIMDAEFERGMKATLESDSRFTAEQLQQGRAFAEGFGKVMFIAGAPIAIFFSGLGLMLTAKFVDAKLKLGTGVMIAAWAFVPRIIGAVATAVQLQMMRPESLDGLYRISTGPARFMDPDTASPLLLAFAGRLDVFILWTTVLFGIGLSVVARIPRSSAMLAAGGVWALGSFFALYGALR
jgi:Yip1-like protein